MKRSTSLIFFLFIGHLSFTQNGDPPLDYFKQLNLEEFYGSRVTKLVNHIPYEITETYFLDEPPSRLSGIWLCYSDKIKLRIDFAKIRKNKEYDRNMSWDLNNVLKEKAANIVLYYENESLQ